MARCAYEGRHSSRAGWGCVQRRALQPAKLQCYTHVSSIACVTEMIKSPLSVHKNISHLLANLLNYV